MPVSSSRGRTIWPSSIVCAWSGAARKASTRHARSARETRELLSMSGRILRSAIRRRNKVKGLERHLEVTSALPDCRLAPPQWLKTRRHRGSPSHEPPASRGQHGVCKHVRREPSVAGSLSERPIHDRASGPDGPGHVPGHGAAAARGRAGALLRPIDLGRRSATDMSDALAVALQRRGVGRGDRVALYLQNIPQVLIAVLAAWKCGAVVVPCNPMLRERELVKVLSDSGSRVLICQEDLYVAVVRRGAAVDARPARHHHVGPRLPGARRRRSRRSWPTPPACATPTVPDLLQLVERHARRDAGRRCPLAATTWPSWSTRPGRPAPRRRR